MELGNTKQWRTGREIETIREAIVSVLAAENPMTVRQVFYRLVSLGVIGKTDGEYKHTVCRLLTEMRRGGRVPYGWLADNTRWMRKPNTVSGVEQALMRTAQAYRRSVWDNQDVYLEIWLEKYALASVLVEETAEWDVPLMVTRGYPNETYLNEAAETIKEKEKPVHLYYFGDYDPSGVDIPRKVEAGIQQLAPAAEVHFKRVAVLPEQIEALGLPTRPTKKTDSRAKSFASESVEVDAIPPSTLRQLVPGVTERHLDRRALDVLGTEEREEKEFLAWLVNAGLQEWRARQ